MSARTDADDAERELTAEVLAQTRRFLAREVDAARIDRDGAIPRAVIESAAGLGLFGLTIPCEYGGSGLSMSGACRVVEELARHDRSIAIMVGLHAGLGTRAIIEFGSDELKRAVLPRMASGELVGAFAATEAEAGSDLMSVRTRATMEDAGLVLDGEKSYVTNGGFAGIFTVLARTPGLGGARAHSLLCVDRETPGLTVGPEEDKLGIRGSSTVTVRFDGARVRSARVLGDGGRGMDQAHRALAWGRTVMAAGCVGTARAALDAALSHVTARRQFGRFIGDFSATKAHVAAMAARLYAMESLVRAVTAREARGLPIELPSIDAKVLCSEGAFALCDTAVQLHGALGFIEPVGVARMLRDCRITRIFEGANDVLLVRAGVALLAAPAREERVDAPPSVSAPEGRYMRNAIDGLGAELDRAIAQARAEHGVRAVHQQLLLQRLARAAICRSAARATLERGLSDASSMGLALAEHAVEMLACEGERCLADARRAKADEARAELVSGLLYGRRGGTAGASEEAMR